MTGPMFQGSFVALITPFAEDGSIDEKAFQDLVRWQFEQGTAGVVSAGTTGESPTITHPEHRRLTELAIEAAEGRGAVIAGTGSNSTEEAIELTRHAAQSGADAALLVTPYYNKPNQEGLYQHFKAVHDAAEIPIVIYNIPGRSIVDMSVETMVRLAELPRVIGVKDSSQDVLRPLATRRAIGSDFVQLSGEDATIMAFLVMGGHGCISVTANVAPKLLAELHAAWQSGDLARAQEINERLQPLHETLFSEPSPGPVKYAASLLGLSRNSLRLPLVPVAPATEQRVRGAMEELGLLG